MMNQICPSDFSGPLGMIFSFLIGIGGMVGSSIVGDVAEKYWYIFLCFIFPTELIRFILMIFVYPYESPYYVYSQISKKIKKKFSKNPDSDKIIEDVDEMIKDEFLDNDEVNRLVKDFYVPNDFYKQKLYLYNVISKYEEQKSQFKGICATAFSTKFRRQFFMGIVLNLGNQLTGINVFFLYAKQIYQDLGFSNSNLLVFLGSNSNKILDCLLVLYFPFVLLTNLEENSL
jgi:hypothetical protein